MKPFGVLVASDVAVKKEGLFTEITMSIFVSLNNLN